MPKKLDPGLEAWRERVEAAEASSKPEPRGKPIEEMSLEELEAERKRLEWEQTKADYERLAKKKRERDEGRQLGRQLGLASNQRRSFAEFIKPRPYYR